MFEKIFGIINRELQAKTIMRHHLTPIRRAVFQREKIMCYQRCREKRALVHCWWKCGLLQSSQRRAWTFPTELIYCSQEVGTVMYSYNLSIQEAEDFHEFKASVLFRTGSGQARILNDTFSQGKSNRLILCSSNPIAHHRSEDSPSG